MVKLLFLPFFLFSGFLMAQVPFPSPEKKVRVVSPEQNILKILADSLLRPALYKKACNSEFFQPGMKVLVYDSTWHLPEPIMVYKYGKSNVSHAELMTLTERQIINFGAREALVFDSYALRNVQFTSSSKDFRPGYYFVRFSQPMGYEDGLFYDVWVKDKQSSAGINILFKTDLRGMVKSWLVYSDCKPRE